VTIEHVASLTGLPARWIRRAAKARGHVEHHDMAPCPSVPCAWCDALLWVRDHAEEVRTENTRREQRRVHRQVMASEAWKRDHVDLWDFLSDMEPGSFRNAAKASIDKGSVSEPLEQALTGLVQRKRACPPDVGTTVDTTGRVTDIREVSDPRYGSSLRVQFVTTTGWSGRVEFGEPPAIALWRSQPLGTMVPVQGRVVWRTDTFAVVDAVAGLSPRTP